jgi:hypothetical protein
MRRRVFSHERSSWWRFETGLAWLNRAGFCPAAIISSSLSYRVVGRCLASFQSGSANRHVRTIARPMDDNSE